MQAYILHYALILLITNSCIYK